MAFINYSEKGSAIKLLNQLSDNSDLIVSYESKPVPRFKLFLLLAVLLYSFSYIFTEFDFGQIKFRQKEISSVTMVLTILIVLCLTGCDNSTSDVLQGSFAFAQKQYSKAVTFFHSAEESARKKEDSQFLDYTIYDLGTAYSLMGEDEAALEKFYLISEDAPAAIRYSAWYNAGIIAHKNKDYENAAEYFKKALEADSTRLEAKINLELSIQSIEVNVQHSQSQAVPSVDDNQDIQNMEKAVFERIKENDRKQWKSSETNQSQNLADDY